MSGEEKLGHYSLNVEGLALEEATGGKSPFQMASNSPLTREKFTSRTRQGRKLSLRGMKEVSPLTAGTGLGILKQT